MAVVRIPSIQLANNGGYGVDAEITDGSIEQEAKRLGSNGGQVSHSKAHRSKVAVDGSATDELVILNGREVYDDLAASGYPHGDAINALVDEDTSPGNIEKLLRQGKRDGDSTRKCEDVGIGSKLQGNGSGKDKQTTDKSFIKALTGSSPPPKMKAPRMEGGNITIDIDKEEYRKGVEASKFCVFGRLFLHKGADPITTMMLKTKMREVWRLEDFHLMPIGKNYYYVVLQSEEAQGLVMNIGALSMKQGVFRVSRWTSDFNPATQRQTTAQVWIRIFGLPVEYWRSSIIYNIARGVGLPIKMDPSTSTMAYGVYARVLVEVDLATPLPERLLLKRQGKNFFVEVQYERMPAFCVHCSFVGHHISSCNRLLKDQIVSNKANKPKGKLAMDHDDQEETKVIEQAIEKAASDLIEEAFDNVFKEMVEAGDFAGIDDKEGHTGNVINQVNTKVDEAVAVVGMKSNMERGGLSKSTGNNKAGSSIREGDESVKILNVQQHNTHVHNMVCTDKNQDVDGNACMRSEGDGFNKGLEQSIHDSEQVSVASNDSIYNGSLRDNLEDGFEGKFAGSNKKKTKTKITTKWGDVSDDDEITKRSNGTKLWKQPSGEMVLSTDMAEKLRMVNKLDEEVIYHDQELGVLAHKSGMCYHLSNKVYFRPFDIQAGDFRVLFYRSAPPEFAIAVKGKYEDSNRDVYRSSDWDNRFVYNIKRADYKAGLLGLFVDMLISIKEANV